MADKSFQDTKWILDSADQNEPEKWNESETIFLSDYFVQFLQDGNYHSNIFIKAETLFFI